MNDVVAGLLIDLSIPNTYGGGDLSVPDDIAMTWTGLVDETESAIVYASYIRRAKRELAESEARMSEKMKALGAAAREYQIGQIYNTMPVCPKCVPEGVAFEPGELAVLCEHGKLRKMRR